jgi:hypothetical protein
MAAQAGAPGDWNCHAKSANRSAIAGRRIADRHMAAHRSPIGRGKITLRRIADRHMAAPLRVRWRFVRFARACGWGGRGPARA